MKLSAIVITKDAEKKLSECLKSLKFADEILVVDSGSTDKTVEMAKQLRTRVVEVKPFGYAYSRDAGAREARGDWLLYIDADEVVTPKFKDEVLEKIQNPKSKIQSYRIYRRNIILGKWLKHGGWWPDPVHRLMKKSALKGWKGKLHEQPVVEGEAGLIREPIDHLSKDSISEMVQNSRYFAPIEAGLMFEAGHPPVKVYHFLLAMGREFWRRAVVKAGWLDGLVGVIEIFYQMFHQVLVYATLWQMQKQRNKAS